MNGRTIAGLGFVVLILSGVICACKKEEEYPPNTTPIEELIQAGKAPVTIGRLSKGISPIAPTFTVSVTNISRSPIKLVNGTVLFFDSDGAFLPDTKGESGYSDVSPIKPGETIELSIMTQNVKATSGKWIISEVVYEKQDPKFKEYGGLPYKWKNSKFEADLAAAEGKK